MSSGEIEQEIRRTRARMGETLDELEDRISPAHIKQELEHTVRRTIDDVRTHYSPKKMARRARNTMFDTIKDNPVPALAAGLSIGYLFMKGAEGNGARRGEYARRRLYDVGYGGRYDMEYDRRYEADYDRDFAGRYDRDYAGPYDRDFAARYDREFETRGYGGPYDPYAAGQPVRPEVRREYLTEDDIESDGSSGRGISERFEKGADDARERMGEARERAGEMTGEAAERARHSMHRAEERTRRVARQARRRAQRAEHSMEEFVYDNPLAAGALAVGVGALLGGLLPSTSIEDEWMGPARDEAASRAKRVAESTMETGRESARRVMHEAKESARDLAETAKSEAKRTAETAKDRAASEAEDTRSGESRGRSDSLGTSESF